MNITQKVITTISCTALAGVLTFGATASAASPDGNDGRENGSHPRAEYICEHQTQVSERLAKTKTRLEERITKLTERRAQAVESGNDDAVARIDKRLERLNNLLDKVTKRATQLPTWIAEHCDPAG